MVDIQTTFLVLGVGVNMKPKGEASEDTIAALHLLQSQSAYGGWKSERP
jgi:hypothetical protein